MLAVAALSVALVGLAPVNATAGTETVPIKQWAKSTCKALAGYQLALSGARPAVGPTVDPAAAKELVVDYLDDAVKGTGRLVRALEAAGAPDVRRGAAVAATFVEAFQKMRTALVRSRSAARDLDTEPTAFLADLTAIEARIQKSMTTLVTTFQRAADRYDLPQLDSALRFDTRCQDAGLT